MCMPHAVDVASISRFAGSHAGRSKIKALFLLLAGSLLFALTASPSRAHTAVAGTTPPDGSVLEASPTSVEIRFRAPVSLTSVMLLEPGKPERKLQFQPRGSAAAFTVPNPQLGLGRNEIRWKALSRDGHVVQGALVLTVKPPGANSR